MPDSSCDHMKKYTEDKGKQEIRNYKYLKHWTIELHREGASLVHEQPTVRRKEFSFKVERKRGKNKPSKEALPLVLKEKLQ